MPAMVDFYSVKEVQKAPEQRVHHNNNSCAEVAKILHYDRRPGTGGYKLCVECSKLNAVGR
jgi:hypothetical protein